MDAVLFFFSSCFSLDNYYWPMYFYWFFPQLCYLLAKMMKALFVFVIVFFITSISVWFFLIFYIFLLKLPIFSCILYAFAFREINMLSNSTIKFILHSPSKIFHICVTSDFTSIDCLRGVYSSSCLACLLLKDTHR